MKTTSWLAGLTAFFLTLSVGRSETVLLTNSMTTNFCVNIPVGKMMIIRAATLQQVWITRGDVVYNSGGIAAGVYSTAAQPRYIVGPCTFSGQFSSSGLEGIGFLTYDLVLANGIQTLIGTNEVIEVTAGMRLRLLDGSYPTYISVTSTNGVTTGRMSVGYSTGSISGADCHPNAFEVKGPFVVTAAGANGGAKAFYLTYYLASDVAQVVGGAVQSPAGSLITVEKSTDLKTWSPAYAVSEQDTPGGYYRFRVVR